jgi:hypothetical protein
MIALVVIGGAAIDQGRGVGRIELDRLVEIGHGLVDVAFEHIGHAAIGVRPGQRLVRHLAGLDQGGAAADLHSERKLVCHVSAPRDLRLQLRRRRRDRNRRCQNGCGAGKGAPCHSRHESRSPG